MTAAMIRRWQRRWGTIGHVDAFDGRRLLGWAHAPGGVRVEAWIDDVCVARCHPDERRIDVAAAYPDRTGTDLCGFSLTLPEDPVRPGTLGELTIVARPSVRPWPGASTLARYTLAGEGLGRTFDAGLGTHPPGPFPREVTQAVAASWPELTADLASDTGQRRFVAQLKRLLASPHLVSSPALTDYARYLSATWAHCQYVARFFPALNPTPGAGGADFHAKPNSVGEMFAIIHQLYVLRSWGVAGDFAEFGCFKGYSTAMLSFACRQLGLTMHVFDSFEGLPPSEGSGYQAGQYAGSLDEVRDNVTRFGCVDAVQFHRGFFADSLKHWERRPLMCLWMDVDLASSAGDLMVVADMLEPGAGLFSHECSADLFRNGGIVAEPAPDNPVPPMLARMAALGRPLTGRYVIGFTAAFWTEQGGIPVLANDVLIDLARSVTAPAA